MRIAGRVHAHVAQQAVKERFGHAANFTGPTELRSHPHHLVVRPGKTCERLPWANLAHNPHCAHIAPTLRPHCAHIAPILRRSNFPRVRLCIPDRWSGLRLRRAFGAFSALTGRTSIQPGFVRKARPWQRRGADIRMLSGDPQVLPGRTTSAQSQSMP